MVFEVKATYNKNGNSRSRPIVAEDGEEARQIAEAEWDIKAGDPDFRWDIQQRLDESGDLERLLVDAERRRFLDEAYRW